MGMYSVLDKKHSKEKFMFFLFFLKCRPFLLSRHFGPKLKVRRKQNLIHNTFFYQKWRNKLQNARK